MPTLAPAPNLEEVDACTLDLAHKSEAFCEASIGGRTSRAARLLAETPAILTFNFAAAVILGEDTRVRDQLRRDPGLATRPDPRTGWTALHAACASRWHHLEPARLDGLRAVAELLIAAGADPAAKTEARPGRAAAASGAPVVAVSRTPAAFADPANGAGTIRPDIADVHRVTRDSRDAALAMDRRGRDRLQLLIERQGFEPTTEHL